MDKVLASLKSKEIGLSSQALKDIRFLPNGIGQMDLLHVIYNALEEALKKKPEWALLEPLLKALVKLLLSSSGPGCAVVMAPTNLISVTSLSPSLAAMREVSIVARIDRNSVLGLESRKPVSAWNSSAISMMLRTV